KYLQFLFICLIWGTTFAMIKIGSDGTPPMAGLALRFWFAVLILFIAIILSRRKINMDRDSIKLYLSVGFFSMTLSYYCTYWGMQYIPSSLSSVLWATLPLFIGIFAHFLIREERLNWTRIFAIVVAIIGVIRILSDQKIVINSQILVGSIVVLCGVIVGAYPNVYVKAKKKPYDPVVLIAIAIFIGAIFHSIGATVFHEWSKMVWDFKNIGSAAYLGMFGSATAFVIYYSLLRNISAVKLSFVTFITPIFASLVGWAFLGETITLQEISGVILIFIGLLIYDSRKYYSFLTGKN
ncbi:MAG: EamA family transporter, partial [Candidatus Marinimicrobia bacterium]|nr:EamA family transporter [Candidatus Neomarinimicrobiota bacterium]